MTSANNYLQAIDTADKGVYSLLQKQWGYGYGGTIVEYKNSPLYYLRWIYNSQWTAWGYNYDGTAVYFSNSPAGWLHRIDVNADAIFSRTGLIVNALSDVKSSLSNIFERLASVVDYERRINENAAYLVDFQKVGNTTLSSIFERLASVVDYERRINENAAYLVDFQKVGNTTLSSIYQAFISFGDRWDSQNEFLIDWANRWDSMDKGFWSESDKGALFAKLDGISDRLSIEAGKTILDTIFGDMTFDATGAASAAVGSAIQNAFPFCVPAVLKQMLGLLQADPAPPEFHFDFWGAPLDFGFFDWQGLADMTSWLSRIGFAVMLFANSRRFVYSGGVAGD